MTMSFSKSKKYIAALLLISELGSFIALFSIAEKAYALPAGATPSGAGNAVAIPTTQSCYSIIPPSMSWDCLKNEILESIGLAIANAALRTLTDDIVNWINNGFEGQPLFITDFEGFLKTSGNLASGLFLEKMLTPDQLNLICSPFRFELVVNLFSAVAPPPKCTFADIRMNVEQMYANFQTGGWQSFLAISTQTNNNAFGTFLVKMDQMHAKALEKTAGVKAEIDSGKGFLGFKTCQKYPTSIKAGSVPVYKEDADGIPTGVIDHYKDPETGKTVLEEQDPTQPCEKYTNSTPGAVIADKLSAVFKTDLTGLELADSFNKILSALLRLGVGKLLTTGKGGVAGYQAPPPPSINPLIENMKPDLLTLADQIIERENDYIKIKKESVEVVKKVISTTGEEIEICQGKNKNEIKIITDDLNKKRLEPIENEITASEKKIEAIEDLKEQIETEEAPVKFEFLQRQLRQAHQDIRTDEEIGAANLELADLQKQLSDTQKELNDCKNPSQNTNSSGSIST
ncbi:MAG: hypothetical protein AAB474_00190 [Patescibacteria group bacterium]